MRIKKHDSALGEAFRGQRLNWVRLGLVAVCALMALVGLPFSQTACAAPGPNLAITVRVYDYTQASPTILARAELEAGRIFGEAGLNLVWLDCTPGPTLISPNPCHEAIEDEDVRVRILLAPVRNGLQDSAFGFAIAPALATVYYETALGFARYDERGFEAPIVLGCVMAHEIGHLLLGSNGHSFSGIMRARWNRGDIQEALMGAMHFTPKQATLMQAEVHRRTTLTATPQTPPPSRVPYEAGYEAIPP
jgi:hypothetical protein